MRPLYWLLPGLLFGIPAFAQSVPEPPSVEAAELGTDLRYLSNCLQQGQFAAVDSLLATQSREQREYLLLQLLRNINVTRPASPELHAWVAAQADKAPRWLVEQRVDGFLVQQPAYDFAAQARLLLGQWQQLAWQADYRQQLEQGSFGFKSIYYRGNPELARQQEALLQALEQLPVSLLQRESRTLAAQNIYLPDNRLLSYLLQRTGEPALYSRLWRQPVDQDALAALATINRFHQGNEASELLIAASTNPHLKEPALRQLSALSPLPQQARSYLLGELANRQYGSLVADLLMEVDEPLLLSALAKRLGQHDQNPMTPTLFPDSGTPERRPGL
ncbi:hypothetical protein HQ399_01485 [Aeromonas jandaei]|uniref:HEAT repeat domain-containing protein n=1 Tax=Aeromonas jandaei TaxID=650 RepID=A0ABD7EIY2_AERJA|nr:hypothetical protein [Aeromonas jandaei]QWL60995.1 hypothetical protein HQ399_01485 [Aeromonas jandaei]